MNKLKWSLTRKALMGIVIIFLPVLITFGLVYNHNRVYLKNRILDTLTVIAEAYEGHVYQFLEMSKRRVQDFASDGFIRSQLQKRIHRRGFSTDTLSKHLIINKIVLDKTIKNIHVLSLEGQVVASTNTSEISKDYSREPFYIKGKESVTIVEALVGPGGLPELAISSPIRTKDTGRLIGVIVNCILISELDKLLSGENNKELGAISWGKGKGAWKTLEVYLVNRDSLMITKSIFVKDAVLKQVVNTLPVEAALTSNKEMVRFYKSYRDIEVVGASMYIPSMKWVLLVEIDKNEVLLPVKNVLLSVLITEGVVFVMVVFLFTAFRKRVVRPIRTISDAANDIARGNLDIAIPIKTSDEIGMLCESFNSMSHNIKERTNALVESETRLTEAQRIGHIGNCEWDVAKNKLYGSDEAYRIFGLTQQKFDDTYETFLNCVHPEDRGFVNKSIDAALNNKIPIDIEHRILLKDTTVRFVQKKCVPILNDAGKVIRLVGTVQDITERKRAEEEIHLLQTTTFAVSASKNLHDALVTAMQKVCNITGWVYGEAWNRNPDGTLLERNHAFYTIVDDLEKFSAFTEGITFPVGIGLPGRAWAGKQPMWIPDVTLDPNYLRASIAGELGLKAGIAFPIIADNEVIAVVVFYKLEVAERDERLIKLISAVMAQLGSVIKRKQAEEELHKSEERLRSILDNTPAVVFVKDIQGRYTFINRQYEKLFHVDNAKVKGKTDFDLWPKEVADVLWANDRKVIETNTPIEFEEVVPHNDRLRTYFAVKFPLCDSTGNVYAVCGIAMDITERKQAEEEREKLKEQLYHVQKIESVGTLAGGIAHDFNNILTAIIGFGSLLQTEIKENVTAIDFVHKIMKSAERAANLTRGLLIFSRKQPTNPEPVNLNDVVRNVKSVLARVIREDIKFKTLLTDKNCIVMADSGQIEQVLMNLSTNARDAMTKGGSLTISTDIIEMDDSFIKAHGYGKAGIYALISVSDTGIGMDEKTRERIFEPFFTTKEAGKGTGLGLAIVHGIVKQHNGYINVYSEPGKGTTFRIYLPLIKSAVEKSKAEIHTIPKGGTETVLLAEDDAEVRNLMKIALKGHGYKVIEAVDGGDAINKFKENKDWIRLLILDVIMPIKNGKEAYDAIKKMKPDMKAVFMSGYCKDIIKETDIIEGVSNFISKPVSPIELLRKVREVLDG